MPEIIPHLEILKEIFRQFTSVFPRTWSYSPRPSAAMVVHKTERSVKAGLEKAVAFVAQRVRSLFLGRDTARKKPVKQRPVFDA